MLGWMQMQEPSIRPPCNTLMHSRAGTAWPHPQRRCHTGRHPLPPCLVAVGVLTGQALTAVLAERVLMVAGQAGHSAIFAGIALRTEVGAA